MYDKLKIPMISEAYLNQTIDELFSGIEFPDEPSGLYRPLSYMIGIGGKRIRPKLCLLAYSLFKDAFNSGILEPAAGLEVFHSFTLIHDDIMDRSTLRRGKPTVWKKWNGQTAILSGDVMLIDSYKRIARAPVEVLEPVLELFSDTAARVCEGQQLDMDFENEDCVQMADYEQMIGLKTAVLIACAAKMGALIAGAEPACCRSLYEYGYRLGMAFQIADDYLDAFGDEKVFGKPIGGDILNNKKSWLTVQAMLKTSDRKSLADIMNREANSADERKSKISAVKAIYCELGLDTQARAEVRRYSELAMEALREINLGAVRTEVLRRFALSLVERAR